MVPITHAHARLHASPEPIPQATPAANTGAAAARPQARSTWGQSIGLNGSILPHLYRPIASLGLAGIGGSLILAAAPPLAAAYAAAPVVSQVAYFAGATALSWPLVSTGIEAIGALGGLLLGVLGTAAFAPAALPVAYLLSGAGGAILGSLGARFPEQILAFLQTLVGALCVAMVILAAITLYAAHKGYAAPRVNCPSLNACPDLPMRPVKP